MSKLLQMKFDYQTKHHCVYITDAVLRHVQSLLSWTVALSLTHTRIRLVPDSSAD